MCVVDFSINDLFKVSFKVIGTQLLPNEEDQAPYHQLLATHYRKHQEDRDRVIYDLPYHLARSDQPDLLVDYYYHHQIGKYLQGFERRLNLKVPSLLY